MKNAILKTGFNRETQLLTLVSGAILLNLYLFGVDGGLFDISLLFSGVGLLSVSMLVTFISICISRSVNEKYLAFYLYIFTLSLTFMTVARFEIFPGLDVISERKVAQYTLDLGVWEPSIHQSATSLAAAILCPILAMVTGLDLWVLFHVDLRLFLALIAVFVFIVLKDLSLGVALRFLGSILLSLNFFFLFGASSYLKTLSSIIFALMMLHCLYRNGRVHRFLGILFAFGVISSHYAYAYFIAFFVSSAYFLPRVLRLTSNSKFHALTVSVFKVKGFIAVFVAIMFGWLLYVAKIVFTATVTTLRDFVEALQYVAFERYNVSSSYPLGSPRGPIITVYFNLQTVLMGVGCLLIICEAVRLGKSNIHLINLALTNASIFFLLLLDMLLPVISTGVDATRLLSFFLPFATPMLAYIVMRTYLSNLKILKVAVILFLLLSLPMNLLLPSHQDDILYHQENDLTPERQILARVVAYSTGADKTFMDFIRLRVPSHLPILGDGVAYFLISKFGSIPKHQSLTIVSSPEVKPFSFLILHKYYLYMGLWSHGGFGVEGGTGRINLKPTMYVPLRSLFGPSCNIICMNGVYLLIGSIDSNGSN